MANNNNMIRMSGMNSGLDTEAIINALTANSKLKITKQNRQLLKYQATQEAYREVIDKMQALKSKYFDILNNGSNLKGTSMWNKYASTTTVGGEEKKIAGFSVSTSLESAAGSYTVKVKETATQSTMKGSSLSSKATVDFDAVDDGGERVYKEGKTYGISVTVGSETKNITFEAGATAKDTIKNVNAALLDAFGESNESAADGTGNVGEVKGLVYIDDGLDANGQPILDANGDPITANIGRFISREGKGLTISGVGEMKSSSDIDINSVETGNNAVSIQIGSEVFNVSFQTLKSDYFEFDQKVDENGDPVVDGEGNPVYETALSEDKQKLFDQIKEDYIESKKYEQYTAWKESAAYETEKADLQHQAFLNAENEQKEKYLDKYLTKEFNKFVKENDLSFVNNDAKKAAYETWKAENYDTGGENGPLHTGFDEYYYETSKIKEAQDNFVAVEYEKYVDSYTGAPEDKLSEEQWKEANITNGEAGQDIYDRYNAVGKKYGYNLDETTWSSLKYNEYQAYKSINIDTSEEASAQFEANLNIDNQKIIKHYNESSLKNSIGALETKDGVKFKVTEDELTAGKYNITATKTVPVYKTDVNGEIMVDENGKPIVDTDIDGKEITQEEPYEFSVTAAKGSVNSFGFDTATTSVSQISNSTKISDLGVTSENGKYEFSINGVDFSFDGDMTVKDMMSRVNASKANVKMTYSSLENSFKIVANEYGVNSSVKITGDSQHLLESIGLTDDPEKYTQGTNLVVDINGRTMQSNGNSVTVDGTTFSFAGNREYPDEFEVNIEKDYSAIKDTIKSFVEDYNKLIEDVYKLLDEKPDKDYYFLADADKEDMDLSEKQEEKWEKKAKQGLLYHDSTISTAMTRLRTSLMGFITGADGNDVSLASIGIKTSNDYQDHGKLVLDEDKLTQAIMERGEDIAKLFSDKEEGIMTKFADALEGAVGTTGDKGTLINKAGMATGTSATNNFIYNQMKRITKNISTLERRYEKEQDRLWKKYSAMESMMGTLNSQSAQMSSYFGGGM